LPSLSHPCASHRSFFTFDHAHTLLCSEFFSSVRFFLHSFGFMFRWFFALFDWRMCYPSLFFRSWLLIHTCLSCRSHHRTVCSARSFLTDTPVWILVGTRICSNQTSYFAVKSCVACVYSGGRAGLVGLVSVFIGTTVRNWSWLNLLCRVNRI